MAKPLARWGRGSRALRSHVGTQREAFGFSRWIKQINVLEQLSGRRFPSVGSSGHINAMLLQPINFIMQPKQAFLGYWPDDINLSFRQQYFIFYTAGIGIDPVLPFLQAEQLLGSVLTFKVHTVRWENK